MRDRKCGELRAKDVGQKVTLAGWVNTIRDHGDTIFIDIRDITGLTQVVIKKEKLDSQYVSTVETLSRESVIEIIGDVRARPNGTTNTEINTGEIEIDCETINILNKCEPLPYHWKDAENASEQIRLRYRYVDLRNPKLQHKIITRHKTTSAVRRYLESIDFMEFETPMMGKSTPEGARDYLVPSRVHKGKFYALPQSPQLYKQMLMIAGFNKYYQLARCFRDEDLRPDRQPEFTQIDLEMSFVTQDDVINIVEGMLANVFKEVKGLDVQIPFPRMSYHDAMNTYGMDKPDTRFGLEMKDITELIPKDISIFESIFESKGVIKAINVEGMGGLSRKKLDKYRRYVQTFKAKDLGFIALKDGEIKSALTRFVKEEDMKKIIDFMGAKDGDMIFFIGGPQKIVWRGLGELRLKLGADLDLIPKDQYNFLWVVDFPLFEWSEEEERWTAMHHPFTSCKPEYLDTFDTDQGNALANAYDIVLNGYEIGGGSIRIHRPDIQSRMFRALNIPDEIVDINFSFLTEALKYGAPPHGGLAIGLDRLVMLLLHEDNIREVIPFPKTRNAVLLLGGAPSEVTKQQLDDVGIEIKAEYLIKLEKEKAEKENEKAD